MNRITLILLFVLHSVQAATFDRSRKSSFVVHQNENVGDDYEAAEKMIFDAVERVENAALHALEDEVGTFFHNLEHEGNHVNGNIHFNRDVSHHSNKKVNSDHVSESKGRISRAVMGVLHDMKVGFLEPY